MAQAIARSLLAPTDTVESAGLETADGLRLVCDAVRAMSEVHLDIGDHLSRQIEHVDPASYDAVIALDSRTASCLAIKYKIAAPRLKDLSVADPYCQGMAVYRACRDELLLKVPAVLQDLRCIGGSET